MLLDFIFPKSCVGCQKIGVAFCSSCIKELKPVLIDVCPYCFRSSPKGMTHERCRAQFGLDGAISILRYNAIAKKIVKNIKYRFAFDIYRQITEVIPKHWWRSEAYETFIREETVIQPIPLHDYRRNIRGFNQAELISSYFSKLSSFKVTNTLKRIINTMPQARIPTKAGRKKNIKGAFTVENREEIDGKVIILVDDIFTSASTAKEAASVLKKAGARQVFLYTFAHGS